MPSNRTERSNRPNAYDLAWWNPTLATWRRFNVPQGNGWAMTIADGQSCGAVGARTLTAYFVCSASATTPVFTLLNETSTCQYSAVILTSLACNASQLASTVTEGCGGQYDLTFATQRDLIYQPAGSNAYYVSRPCGVVDNAICQSNSNTNSSMMCQVIQGSTTTYDIAIYNPTQVTYSPTLTGISMSIQDGDGCGDLGARSLTVNFVCQPGQGPRSVAFTNLVEVSTCNYVATVATSAVCRQGRQNGICGNRNGVSLAGTSEYSYTTPNGDYTYYFQPCGQVLNSQCNASPSTQNSMMCQAVIGAATTYNVAYYDSQLVSWLPIQGGQRVRAGRNLVQYQWTGLRSCTDCEFCVRNHRGIQQPH